MSYNGWKNYETWLVKMEFVGDCELDVFDDVDFLFGEIEEEDRLDRVASILEGQFEEFFHANVDNSLLLTLLQKAGEEVDWTEIAGHLIDDWIQEHPESLWHVTG